MNGDSIAERLDRLFPGRWELYEKSGESREAAATAAGRSERVRGESGWAVRWWDPAPRFAAASDPTRLEEAMRSAGEVAASAEPVPVWPGAPARRDDDPAAAEPAEPALPDLFEELSRLLAAESRGEARLEELVVRGGRSRERIRNAAGRDVAWTASRLDGRARAIGRRATRASEARALFRWDGAADLRDLARRLSDRATLPLSGRAAPFERGEWMLDPSVAAGLLGALAPLFTGDVLPRWAKRAPVFTPQVAIVDDATPDASYDGEGVRTRRVLLVGSGEISGRLHDLASAREHGIESTGHGVRHSFRAPPIRAARRLFFEAERPAAPPDLLASVRRGLFASALTAPFRCDLEQDRFEAEFAGVSIVAGRAQGAVAGARARGRVSDLLRRIAALSSDLRFFPMPDPVGAPTVLIERAAFD